MKNRREDEQKMYELIAIDLDGTLLNAYGEISNEDKAAIQKQIQKGVEVVLTSGRTISAMENFAEEVGANHYLISGNGTAIYDLKKQQVIYHQYLSKDKILEIVKICEQHSMYYNVYTDRSIITKSLNFNTLFYYSENLKKPIEKRTNIEIVNNMAEYIEKMSNEPFLKITICDHDKMIFNRMMQMLKQIENIDVLEVAHMARKIIEIGGEQQELAYYYTEITSKHVNKWNAILKLAQKLQIEPEKILAIGDNVNDLEMLKNAGAGIAMGNSAPEVKKVATFVTEENINSGVGMALNLLNEVY